MHESQDSPAISSESLSKLSVISEDKISYWEAHFESWEHSGLNQSEYCRRHNLKYCVFHYWKRKLRKPMPADVAPEGPGFNFVEVGSSLPFGRRLSPLTAPDDFFRLWVGGVCVEVGNNFDAHSLSQLLGCLRTL